MREKPYLDVGIVSKYKLGYYIDVWTPLRIRKILHLLSVRAHMPLFTHPPAGILIVLLPSQSSPL